METHLYFCLHFFQDFAGWSVAHSAQSAVGCLAHVVEHTVGPRWDINGDLSSAQLCEGLGIQNQEERTFILETKRF